MKERYYAAYLRLMDKGQYMEAIQAFAHWLRCGGNWRDIH